MQAILDFYDKELRKIFESYAAADQVSAMAAKVSASTINLAELTYMAKEGKLLDALRDQGGQVLDLEAAADHKGSVLGEELHTNFTQPSQKMFESRLAHEARGFDPSRPIFVEGESSLIGRCNIPKSLWARMKQASVTEVDGIARHCRGWWGAPTGRAQVAERAVFDLLGFGGDLLERTVEVGVDGDPDLVSVTAGERSWTVRVEQGREVPTISCSVPGGEPIKPGREWDVVEVTEVQR